jgi:hypothetical protein
MKLSFLPGDLHLSDESNGYFVIKVQGQEQVRTRSKRAAVSKFNKLRQELETCYPVHELTPEQKAETFRVAVGEWISTQYASRQRKKKSTAGSTRTFGG